MDKQEKLKSQNVSSQVTYDPSRGYPTGTDLYYGCPVCHFWMPSLPADYSEADCTCGNISIDIDMARLLVRDDNSQPHLLRLSPKKG